MEWHTEDCWDRACGGDCHRVYVECGECGDHEMVEERAFDRGGVPECCGAPMSEPRGGVEDEARAERRQMGLTAL